MANTVSIEINTQQIESAVEKLGITEKLKIIRKLEKETRRVRWDSFISKIRKRFAKNPISDSEITKVCEQARQERYERNRKTHQNNY